MEQPARSGPADPFRELMLAVANDRDRAAFRALFDHYAPRVKSFLMRGGATPALAEELVQEVMLTVWRRAELFDPQKAAVGTWIFTIARNRRIDALRRERRPEYDPNDPSLVPAPEPEADHVIGAARDAARLRDAIRELPAAQVQVLELSYFADVPHSTIADRLDLPLGTVKSRLRLALRRLRSILQDEL